MQGSKKGAFRRHNATRNVRFAGTTRSMCSKRYPEPVDTKDLTMVGVAGVSVAFSRLNFVEDIQFPRLWRPLMAKFSEVFVVRQ